MKEHGLAVRGSQLRKAERKPTGDKPGPTRPNQWWGIDMTKVMIEGFGWVSVVIVLDWNTKKAVGHSAGLQARAWHWLAALNKAVNRQFPEGARGAGLNLMSDNGCQPTAVSFMKACRGMGVNQAFTGYSSPKGNADTERFMRTLKEELVWINEFTSPGTFLEALDRWLDGYNAFDPRLQVTGGLRGRTPQPRDALRGRLLNEGQYMLTSPSLLQTIRNPRKWLLPIKREQGERDDFERADGRHPARGRQGLDGPSRQTSRPSEQTIDTAALQRHERRRYPYRPYPLAK